MKKEAGITLITLVITIVIILILTSTVVINLNTGTEYKNYKKMCADIEILEEKALLYYQKYGEVPVTGNPLDISNIEQMNTETGDFYEIDINKFSNLTLNYGIKEDENDLYVINEISLNVYYLKGIEYQEGISYRYE